MPAQQVHLQFNNSVNFWTTGIYQYPVPYRYRLFFITTLSGWRLKINLPVSTYKKNRRQKILKKRIIFRWKD